MNPHATTPIERLTIKECMELVNGYWDATLRVFSSTEDAHPRAFSCSESGVVESFNTFLPTHAWQLTKNGKEDYLALAFDRSHPSVLVNNVSGVTAREALGRLLIECMRQEEKRVKGGAPSDPVLFKDNS